ncbi:MAG: HTH domain-containing protein [Bacteroidetes bacterium]|jgi:ATP-dependent DNA helicase RecG|nr:HTH domain-containing protein [Bacteroidota bacterium]MBT3802486.1 HTH domain-containing protein [Bacteroidota bacterium]MBT5531298.1 HTH domain-containing protein [Cytophagia bacterium]MBT5992472.1 HTH domain-containing protein [Bacteroidota bacterium]MBT6837080.1 HTH domain-containing protein [Bacteroidota bacterium]
MSKRTISERFRKDFGSEFGKEAEAIHNILMQNPYSTAQEIAQELDKTDRTIENYLSKLKKTNIIIRKGPKLGGYWEFIDR